MIGRLIKYCDFKSVIVLMFVVALGACMAPSAPILRQDINDGYGLIIPDCQNVSPAAEVTAYDTAFYHSTWSSAWIEGAQLGFRAGLEVDGEQRPFVRFKKEFAYTIMLQVFGIDGRNYPFPPFCMLYDAPISEVADAVGNIMPVLGNPVILSNKEHALFGTDFYERGHMMAKWRDRYIISLGETTSGQTAVKVFRGLFIARVQPVERGAKRPTALT